MTSLASRVALATALSIGAAGIVVAVVGVGLAHQLETVDEHARLIDAAGTLAAELAEAGADPAFVAEDETRELAHTGIRIAIYEDARFVAGDRAVPEAPASGCVSRDSLRACGVEVRGLVAVAARDSAQAGRDLTSFSISVALAVVLTTLLGALVARRIARLSLAPLVRLTDAVATLDPASPIGASLGPDEGALEIDVLRRTISALVERLTRSLASAQRFAADAAHELRTPMTTIQGELELAREGLDPSASAQSIARAHATAARVSTLLERLLVLARPDGALDRTERVDLREVAEDVVLALPAPLAARVHSELGDGALAVDGDATLLAAMLGNALENALKFSESAPVQLRARLEAARIVIDVDDQGPGIAAEDREDLFRPFHRSPAARASGVKGHGVGLALIAHVAKLHRGSARFEDRERGARLRIELPRAREPSPAITRRGGARS